MPNEECNGQDFNGFLLDLEPTLVKTIWRYKIPEGKLILPEVTTKTLGELVTLSVSPPPEEPACGIRDANGVDFKITENNANKAEYIE
ncbi:hypothetical protein ILUMI_18029 [Ignelater luminosus]|uniref:Uncharacterized protein n=1 Tax=Ignelater luminosus TaxID=2038154 RepID=A0A8K0CIT5_IGNLU|nr:hypothetical protein ILUMI_18029 [Ignelater luminosus]